MPFYAIALLQESGGDAASRAGAEIAKLIYDASDIVYFFGANLAVTTLLVISLRILYQAWRNDSSYATSLTINMFLPFAGVVFYMVAAPDIAQFAIDTIGLSDRMATGYAWLDAIINVLMAFILPIFKSIFSLSLTVQGVKSLFYIITTWGQGDYLSMLFSMFKHYIKFGIIGMMFGGIGDVISMIMKSIAA